MDRENMLRRLGLEQRTPTTDFLTGLGLFTVGVLVGTGLGIIFAPKAGTEMRTQLGESLRRGRRRAEEYGRAAETEIGSPAPGHVS
jgi:gas vesicle protein